MKNLTHTKTEFIQFRVDTDLKALAKETANEYFNGNMGDLFRYSLHNCDFEDGDNANGSKNTSVEGRNFTSLSAEDVDWLATIHDDYDNLNTGLNRIGNNLNQISHQVNAQALTNPSPITKDVAGKLGRIETAINSMRTNNGNIWSRVKAFITNHSNEKDL